MYEYQISTPWYNLVFFGLGCLYTYVNENRGKSHKALTPLSAKKKNHLGITQPLFKQRLNF